MPSLLTGMARILDLGATLSKHSYNFSATPEEADSEAIWSDWVMVGQDIQAVYDDMLDSEASVGPA